MKKFALSLVAVSALGLAACQGGTTNEAADNTAANEMEVTNTADYEVDAATNDAQNSANDALNSIENAAADAANVAENAAQDISNTVENATR